MFVETINRLLILEKRLSALDKDEQNPFICKVLGLPGCSQDEIAALLRALDLLEKAKQKQSSCTSQDYEIYNEIRSMAAQAAIAA